jgi:hypothetical protein
VAGAAPPDDIEFQELTWRMQRFAWWTCLVVMALATGGVFGAGPLARTELVHGAASIRYEWIQRVGRGTVLTISTGTAREARLELRGSALGNLTLLGVMPPAARMHLPDGALLLVLPSDAVGATVEVRAEPKAAGVFRGSVLVDGQPSGTLRFVVLP